jgi:hypothetical protein
MQSHLGIANNQFVTGLSHQCSPLMRQISVVFPPARQPALRQRKPVAQAGA